MNDPSAAIAAAAASGKKIATPVSSEHGSSSSAGAGDVDRPVAGSAPATAASCRLSRQDSSASGNSYDRHWKRIKSRTSRDLEQSEIAARYGCAVERLYQGPHRKRWSAILSGESIGLYETKEEGIKRAVCAALVMNDTNHVSGQSVDPLARAKKRRKKGAGGAKTKKIDKPTSEEIRIGKLDGATALDDTTIVTLRQPSYGIHDLDCIACQDEKATIVFEPCLHCVLCSRCNQKGICKSWCPTCRTIITGRLQPHSARVIRPQVYSAYSFM